MFRKPIFALLMLIVALALLTGCGLRIHTPDPVCAKIPAGSYSVICMLADKLDTTPETMGAMLKVGNTVSMAADAYTAVQAKAFVGEIRAFLKRAKKNGLAYAAALEGLKQKYKSLPASVRGVFTIVDDFVVVDAGEIAEMNLSDYDYSMIFFHLDEQDTIISQFLV